MMSLSNNPAAPRRPWRPLAALTLLAALLLPCPAAKAAPAPPLPGDSAIAAKAGKEARQLRRQRRDSLRREMRRSAREGRMLQWADSLVRLRRRHDGDTARLARRRRRLAEGDRKLTLLDKIITSHYFNKNIDTTYITRPSETWTVKVRSNFSGTLAEVRGKNNGTRFSGLMTSRFRHTISGAAVYKGIGIGLALNPSRIIGKTRDMEYRLNSYGNRMGFDISYERAKTDEGNVTIGGERTHVGSGRIHRWMLTANYYYAFNGRRFSFPAAFTQSYRQRKSAGSWLAGVSFQAGKMTVSSAGEGFLESGTTHTLDIGIGMGYAYNLCLGRRWLANISLLPNIVVYDHSSAEGHGLAKTRMKYRFPNILATGQSALLYSWKNRFAGTSAVLNGSYTGSQSHLTVHRLKWRVRLFYGFRF